jgi:hypothetical protein
MAEMEYEKNQGELMMFKNAVLSGTPFEGHIILSCVHAYTRVRIPLWVYLRFTLLCSVVINTAFGSNLRQNRSQ